MSYAKVTLYRVDWTAEQNFMVDNINSYLAELDITADRHLNFNDVQFQKHNLDLEIKLPIAQNVLAKKWNYVKIVNDDDDDVWGNPIPFYYYVTKYTWTSQSSCKLELSMDTLNSCQTYIKNHFTAKTHVVREHKDRFVQRLNSNTLRRKIDVNSEFQGLIKYQISSQNVVSEDDALLNPQGRGANKWYLVYTSDNETPISNPDTNHAINVYLIPKETMYAYVPPGEEEDIYINYFLYPTQTDKFVIFGIQSDCNFTVNNVNYTIPDNDHFLVIHCQGQSYDITLVDKVNSTATTLGYCAYPSLITFNSRTYISQTLDLNDYAGATFTAKYINAYNDSNTNLYRWSFAATGMHELLNINELNKTLSYLIKIVACPYFPLPYELHSRMTIEKPAQCSIARTIELGNSYTKDALKIDTVDESLLTTIDTISMDDEFNVTLPDAADRINTAKNPIYESKLFHSDFYSYIFNYDSFNKLIPLENVESAATWTPLTTIDYKQSNNAKSALGFKFNNTQWVRKVDAYDSYLICSRNNEKAIYNSSYLNYIRNGYNYDVKNKETAEDKTWNSLWTNVGTSALVGAAGGLMSGNPLVGIASGLISGITATITTAVNVYYQNIAAENAINEKIAEAKASANSIVGSDDLDLLEWYNGNFLKLNKFSISDRQKTNVYNLFYYTGYTTDEFKIPDINSRYRFNYLQADIDLDSKESPIFEPYYQDVKARFNLGVTVIHTLNDFAQEKENWESWLV